MQYHYLAYMYRLRHIKRWSLMRNVTDENVAEHSYYVSLLTHTLCTIANEVFHKSVATEKAVCLALFHDATEMITGDIPTPVKHHNPKLLSNFREIEAMAAERLISMVPGDMRSIFSSHILGHQEAPELYAYVKAADLLDAYIKCTSEISAGNREFTVAKVETEQQLKALQMEEVTYFMNHFAPSFEMTLDELSKTATEDYS
ncbi:5'-deoxynucleotidase [Marinicrinis lubricantis]|uniref:5'-deoxynucleotidase n=1 Tax=Marinicrinis lubricantis TaxID=2086470 RepID=A0ABW1II53_9BACL